MNITKELFKQNKKRKLSDSFVEGILYYFLIIWRDVNAQEYEQG